MTGQGLGNAGIVVVIAGSAMVGAVHALLPDHWIPFVLLSRARRWDLRRSLAAAAAGGLAHLVSTAALGLLVALLGTEALKRAGPAAEFAGAGILAVFGLLLSLRGLRSARSGRGHHGHSSGPTPDPSRPASSDRGHLLQGALLGARPCAEAIPVFLAAAAYGLTSSILAILAWVIATLGVMVGIVWLSLLGLSTVKLDFLEKYGEVAAGLLILLMGLAAAVLAGSF
jgi:hypothetical protein